MAPKKKQSKEPKEPNKDLNQNSRGKKTAIFAVTTALVLAAIAWIALRPAQNAEDTGQANSKTAVAEERPVTLSPALFSNDPKAQAAYQVAKDIPEVLEQLPCFCGCMLEYGHKNNLYCFSDQHGSVCEICEDIALRAKELHDQGFTIEQIKQAISGQFSRSAS